MTHLPLRRLRVPFRTAHAGRPWLATMILAIVGVLPACGGGGSGGSEPAATPVEATSPAPATPGTTTPPPPPVPPATDASLIGVQVGAAGNRIAVLAGETIEQVVEVRAIGASAPHVLSVIEGQAILTVLPAVGGRSIRVDAAALSAGTSAPFVLGVRSPASGVVTRVEGVVQVLAPVTLGEGRIPAEGGVIRTTQGDLAVEIGPSAGAAPLGLRIVGADGPGGRLIRLAFDRDVTGERRTVRMTPTIVTNPPVGSAARSQPLSRRQPLDENHPFPIQHDLRIFRGLFTTLGNFRFDPVGGTALVEDLHATCTTNVVVRRLYAGCWQLSVAAQLKGNDVRGSSALQGRVPVLFVHGYTLDKLSTSGGDLGGGPGTWGNLPRVVQGMNPLPGSTGFATFEFQWVSNARYARVADDLAAAIALIHEQTQRKVHVVAHSFGGLVVRSMLQGLGEVAAADLVEQVITLGTPHSGILDAARHEHGVNLPDGQNSVFNGLCDQISCYEAGEAGLGILNVNTAIPRLVGISAAPGVVPAALAQAPLPPGIPFTVGIGLSIQDSSDLALGDGDGLISFAGQRFRPADAIPSAGALQACGDGRLVHEVILGGDTRRPGDRIPLADVGYAHTSSNVGLFSIGANAFEAHVHCDSASSCSHAGFELIRTALTVGPRCTAVVIVAQPAPVAVTAGQPATFNVTARSPTGALAYQWLRDGAPIAGATAATYTLPAAALADSGRRFAVTVTSGPRSVTSDAALLTVSAVPPVNATITSGRRVAAGIETSFAIDTGGRLWVAGNANGSVFGDPDFAGTGWYQVKTLERVAKIATAEFHSVALRDDRSVWVTGNSQWGQLGLGDRLGRTRWTLVPGLSDVVDIAANGNAIVVLRADGTVWGAGAHTRLGMAPNPGIPTGDYHTFVQLPVGVGVRAIGIGFDHLVALGADGSVRVCGSNSIGQTGMGNEGRALCWTRVTTTGMTGIADIGSGDAHVLALRDDGALFVTGANSGFAPVQGAGPRTFTMVAAAGSTRAIHAGFANSFVTGTDGVVRGIGWNEPFQLGIPGAGVVTVLSPIAALAGMKDVASGFAHSVAIGSDGRLLVVGSMVGSRIGLGVGGSFNVPFWIENWTPVPGRSGY